MFMATLISRSGRLNPLWFREVFICEEGEPKVFLWGEDKVLEGEALSTRISWCVWVFSASIKSAPTARCFRSAARKIKS